MTLNFNELPKDKPNQLPPPGKYYALIEKAIMKPPKIRDGVQGPDYLQLTLAITDSKGKMWGKVFDIISQSDHEVVRYKIGRLINALEIPITNVFELKDLTKIIVNKQIIVDITIKKDKEGQYPDKVEVDMFKDEIFYSISKADKIFGATTEIPFIINASDAEDIEPVSDDENY